MTPETKHLVQSSWALVEPIADQAAQLFYGRLFDMDPSLRSMFRNTNMEQQRTKLMRTITVAIQGLDNLPALIPVVEDLGRRHVAYGVRDSHYDTVGAALLWTLQHGLGSAWNDTLAAAWAETYGLLAGVMRRAASNPMATAA